MTYVEKRTPPKKDTIGWDFWRARLRGESPDKPLAMVAIGYYRTQNRTTGVWYPLAIWLGGDGAKRVKRGNSDSTIEILDTAEKEEDFDFKVFSYAQKNPVTYEDYQFWIANREWPEHLNLKPIPQAPAAEKEKPGPRAGGIGDNSGAAPEELEALSAETLRKELAALKPQVTKLAKLTSAEDGNTAQGLRSRLTTLASEGDKLRETEKRPHLEAGRAVDATWNPLISEAKDFANTLRRAIEEHATAELKRKKALEEAERARLQAEARAQQAARDEAARVAREQERERLAAIEAGKPAPEPVQPAPAPEPDPAPLPPAEVAAPAPVEFRGAQGRKTTAKVVIVPTIVDQDAVYEFLKKHPEVVQLLQTLVAKIYKGYAPGMPDMKGVTSVERAAIR